MCISKEKHQHVLYHFYKHDTDFHMVMWWYNKDLILASTIVVFIQVHDCFYGTRPTQCMYNHGCLVLGKRCLLMGWILHLINRLWFWDACVFVGTFVGLPIGSDLGMQVSLIWSSLEFQWILNCASLLFRILDGIPIASEFGVQVSSLRSLLEFQWALIWGFKSLW